MCSRQVHVSDGGRGRGRDWVRWQGEGPGTPLGGQRVGERHRVRRLWWWLTSFFCKGPDGTFNFSGHISLAATWPLQCKSSCGQYLNGEHDGVSVRLCFWTLNFELLIILRSHEIVFFWFFSQLFKDVETVFSSPCFNRNRWWAVVCWLLEYGAKMPVIEGHLLEFFKNRAFVWWSCRRSCIMLSVRHRFIGRLQNYSISAPLVILEHSGNFGRWKERMLGILRVTDWWHTCRGARVRRRPAFQSWSRQLLAV